MAFGRQSGGGGKAACCTRQGGSGAVLFFVGLLLGIVLTLAFNEAMSKISAINLKLDEMRKENRLLIQLLLSGGAKEAGVSKRQAIPIARYD